MIIDETKGIKNRPHTFGRHNTTKSNSDLDDESRTRFNAEAINITFPTTLDSEPGAESPVFTIPPGGANGMVLGVRNPTNSSFPISRAHNNRRAYLNQNEQDEADNPENISRFIYRDLLYNLIGTTGIADATNKSLAFAEQYWGITYVDANEDNVYDYPLGFRAAPNIVGKFMLASHQIASNCLSPYSPNLNPNDAQTPPAFNPGHFPKGAVPNTPEYNEITNLPPPGLENPSQTSNYGTIQDRPQYDIPGSRRPFP